MDSNAIGLISVVVAIFSFGTWGVPLRFKVAKEANLNSTVLQFYSSVVVSLGCLIVLITNDFIFSWWGIPGAVLWVISQILAMSGISKVGIAVGIPVVSGTTIICSFFWGLIFFGEQPSSLFMALLGILLIIIGIVGVGSTSSSLPDRLAVTLGVHRYFAPASTSHDIALPRVDNSTTIELDEEPSLRLSQDNEQPFQKQDEDLLIASSNAQLLSNDHKEETPQTNQDNKVSKRDFSTALASLLLCGVMNGSLMVPFSMFVLETEQKIQLLLLENPSAYIPRTSEVSYLLPFGIGIMIVAPIWLALSQVYLRQWPDFKLKVMFLPGIAPGILWYIGNFAAIYSTANLGQVGYALTQTNMLIAAMWSFFLFREVRGFGVVVLFTSAAVLLGGAALLAAFGTSSSENAPPL